MHKQSIFFKFCLHFEIKSIKQQSSWTRKRDWERNKKEMYKIGQNFGIRWTNVGMNKKKQKTVDFFSFLLYFNAFAHVHFECANAIVYIKINKMNSILNPSQRFLILGNCFFSLRLRFYNFQLFWLNLWFRLMFNFIW